MRMLFLKGRNDVINEMNKGRQGFTLIEILIAVAIISILASVVLVGLGPTQQSGRDARRLSDLHEIQTSLELFYNKCGYYPGSLNAGACATGLPRSRFLSNERGFKLLWRSCGDYDGLGRWAWYQHNAAGSYRNEVVSIHRECGNDSHLIYHRSDA